MKKSLIAIVLGILLMLGIFGTSAYADFSNTTAQLASLNFTLSENYFWSFTDDSKDKEGAKGTLGATLILWKNPDSSDSVIFGNIGLDVFTVTDDLSIWGIAPNVKVEAINKALTKLSDFRFPLLSSVCGYLGENGVFRVGVSVAHDFSSSPKDGWMGGIYFSYSQFPRLDW